MIGSREPSAVLAALMLLALAGCVPMTLTPPAGSPPPAPRGQTPALDSASSAPREQPSEPVPATTDSTPSPDALRVLANIPEPLTPAQQELTPVRSTPPDTLVGRRTMPAPEAAYDTLRVSREPEDGPPAVPVPAPTRPLGQGSGAAVVLTDTLAAMPGTSPGASPPTGGSPASVPASEPAPPPAATTAPAPDAAPAGKGPCWRLQVAAKPTRDEAGPWLEASQSQLVVPMAITIEKGLFKVRTRDCLTREAADALKKRAVDSGFADVFLVDTSAPARPVQPRRVPPSRRKR